VQRTVTVSRGHRGLLALDDDGVTTHWHVASRQHRPSRAALEDAGELAHRETINVWWAVPMQGRSSVGRFWAFFPTEDRTTLAGIVNAPWKMGDDRRNLLPGRFNEEILTEVLPALMAAEWHHLLTPDDPASLLDVLPARGREARSWADDVMNEPIFRYLTNIASLPDVTGRLQKPAVLRLHPRGLDPDLLQLWAAPEPKPAGWVHHGIDRTPERRWKAERLIGDSEVNRPEVTAWIEAICREGDVASSALAVSLVDAVVQVSDFAKEARRSRVLLLEDGSYTAPVPGQVFVRSSDDDEGYLFIHPQLAALPAVVRSLDRLGIQVLDRAGELRNLLHGKRPGDVDWHRAWTLARQCTPVVALQVFREEMPAPLQTSVRVRTRAGNFAPIASAYLPGGIVSAQDTANGKWCIDTGYHRDEAELLGDLGCVSQPTLRHDSPEEPWLRAYKDLIQDKFLESVKGAKPHTDRLEVVSGTVPWPLEPLSVLSGEARAALTTIVLEQTSGEPWRVRHLTNARYGETKSLNPVYWWVLKHGRLRTSFGPMPPALCLMPDPEHPEDVLPVPDVAADVAAALKLSAEPAQLPAEAWAYMLHRAESWDDVRRTFRVYAWAAYFTEGPPTLRAQVGSRSRLVPSSEVAVVTNEETFASLVEQQIPAIIVESDEDFTRLLGAWELEDGNRLLEQELVFQRGGEAMGLIDRFPALRLYLTPDMFDVEIQACESIDLVTTTRDGMRSKPVSHAFEGGQVLVTATEDEAVLRSVSEVLKLGLAPADVRKIIDHIQEQAAQELRADLRNASSDEERIALLVGDEGLRGALPAAAVESIESREGRRLTAVEMAGLVRAVHGVGALQHFRAYLEEQGLNPPRQWAGGSTARRFVVDLGFAAELAGFTTEERPAVFHVDGPAELKPLHDFQHFVTDRIKELLRSEGSKRGMVSLPTGAGKTRVAVQALVEEVADGELWGPVVWIAQSDELCEQAVETWSYIWRAIGPQDRMTISRLWGSNEATEITDAFQLVVATPQKLAARIERPEYDWLKETSVVVVDEAHSSVAPTYTRVLEWLGRRARTRKDDRHLVGLTATPFRNTNKEETQRLISRYDGNRLDEGAFQGPPYAELQERKVLARVQHNLLTGTDVSMTAAELEQARNMPFLPKSVEARLGADQQRNETIVDSLCELPEDWTTLLFATSVENAMVLAAQLTHRGVPAVAISAGTDTSARRHYVEEFKRGRIRVITNYHVLAQGFDAPAVSAVYVTRPTFSANLYQQMIGRGLRGPLNGGSNEVLIVNIEDNIHQFGTQLAFHDFDHLWKPDIDETS
jgi:superfamily II DNA or RNA helicase